MDALSMAIEKWWLMLLRGLFLLALGLAFVLVPGKTIVTVTLFVGLLLLVDGLISSLMGLFARGHDENRWPTLVQGIVGVILGLLVLNWPKATLGLLLFALALWLLVVGIMAIVTSIALRKEMYGNWLMIGLGVVALITSLVLFSNPSGSIVFLSIIYGVATFVVGIFKVALALDLHKMKKDMLKIA